MKTLKSVIVSFRLVLVVFESHESYSKESKGENHATNEAGSIKTATKLFLLNFINYKQYHYSSLVLKNL